eukprot:COSAG03_NODE_1564_length_3868_cov_3.416821_4_plen_151_part_00
MYSYCASTLASTIFTQPASMRVGTVGIVHHHSCFARSCASVILACATEPSDALPRGGAGAGCCFCSGLIRKRSHRSSQSMPRSTECPDSARAPRFSASFCHSMRASSFSDRMSLNLRYSPWVSPVPNSTPNSCLGSPSPGQTLASCHSAR